MDLREGYGAIGVSEFAEQDMRRYSMMRARKESLNGAPEKDSLKGESERRARNESQNGKPHKESLKGVIFLS